MKKVRIGIIGGTFDPIHIGHLIIAQNAVTQYHLDQILFIPTGHSPHKDDKEIEQSAHRLEMIRLSIKNNPDFYFSAMEINAARTSYTYLTLQELHRTYPDWELYFIMGADSLDYLDKWMEPAEICRLATLLVAIRDDLDMNRIKNKAAELKRLYEADIRPIITPNVSVSSHNIRERVAKGEPIRYLVTPEVEEYIAHQCLYQEYEGQTPMNERLNKIKKTLKKELDKDRYEHTLGVMYTSACLAMANGYDMEKAQLAGLLHDCAKCIPNEKKLKICVKNNIPVTQVEKDNPFLLHAKVGAFLARVLYEVEDEEILHAISVHTTGAPAMNTLDKIVFIADYIEPKRDKAANLKEIRKTAFEDLDEALKMILCDTIHYLNGSKNDKNIDPMTLETYHYYTGGSHE